MKKPKQNPDPIRHPRPKRPADRPIWQDWWIRLRLAHLREHPLYNLWLIHGIIPKDTKLYTLAMTHSSANHNSPNQTVNNYERLEFLGDSVLNLVVSHYLYDQMQHEREGHLSKMKSRIVNRHHLHRVGKTIDLTAYIRHHLSLVREDASILGDAVEAFIGAMYLDQGHAFVKTWIHQQVIKPFERHSDMFPDEDSDYKSMVIMYSQQQRQKIRYEELACVNDKTTRLYHIGLVINDCLFDSEWSSAKKKAEQVLSKRYYQNVVQKTLG